LRHPPTKHVQPNSGSEKAFGQALREIRNDRGISQERLSLECGLDRTYISLLERGLRSPTFRNIVKLAHTLEVSLPEMMRRVEKLLSKAPKSAKG
jgi:transcriptional regulator with XRE-family HTH domain